MKIIGLDVGRSCVKVVSGNYMDQFLSVVGEYRVLKDERKLGRTDIILEWNGQKWFGGDLAATESEFPIQDSRASKNHERTKLLAIMAMHRAVQDGDRCFVVTGEPIGDHVSANKEALKKMLVGSYKAIVNGVTKSWTVARCEVAAEGACAVWGIADAPATIHVIDPGSRKTNFSVNINKGLFDRLSGSLDLGCETVQTMQPAFFADAIAAQLSRRWLKQLGPLMVIGGMADQLKPEFARHFENVFVPPNPRFANAKGMYMIGVKLHEQAATQR